jgi:hypothetical protein
MTMDAPVETISEDYPEKAIDVEIANEKQCASMISALQAMSPMRLLAMLIEKRGWRCEIRCVCYNIM